MPGRRSQSRRPRGSARRLQEEQDAIQGPARRLTDPGGWGSCTNYASTFWVGTPAQLRNAISCADRYAVGLEQVFTLYITADITLTKEAEANYGTGIVFPFDTNRYTGDPVGFGRARDNPSLTNQLTETPFGAYSLFLPSPSLLA